MSDIATTIPCHLRTVRGLNEPVVFARDGVIFASSEDVAAYFGKQHNHVMRDVRTLISQDNSCASNFGLTQRDVKMPAGGTRQVAVYHMTRDGFTLLAMGFTGKRALGWKLKYIEAFNAMEVALSTPRPVYDDPEPEQNSKRSRKVAVIDQMDAGMDLLLTAETALRAEGWIDAQTIAAIGNTIGQALKFLAPARERVNSLA